MHSFRAQSVVQWVREGPALAEDLSLVPGTHIWQPTTVCASRSSGYGPLVWPLLIPAFMSVYRHRHTIKNKMKILKKYNFPSFLWDFLGYTVP